ncbi:peptide/nickel transport system substrate-binding protein [Bradyrhizobium sp. USDA 4341]
MTLMSRRGFVAGTAAALSVSTSTRAQEGGPRAGGRLSFVIHPEPTTLVCFNTTEGPAIQASTKVVEGLLAYDFDLNPKPQLATAWSVSEDGLQYRFELRRNVSWHDGQAFTSADVVYSVGLLKSAHPRGRTTFANLIEATAVDEHTVVLKLSRPAPYLLYALAAGESPIVPRHVYQGKGDPLQNPNNRAPIGTGPFVFKEWVLGNYVSYVRNPNYWDSPKPYLEALLVRVIPDGAARAVAFETSELDLGGSTPVSPLDLERFQKISHLGLETRGYEYSPTLYGIEFNLDHPILRNIQVRKAIAHAVDPAVILNVAWYGLGERTVSIVSPTLKRFYNSKVPTYAYDLKAAARLLDEAGFPLKGRWRFALTHDFQPFGENFKRSGEALKSALAAVGIDVTVRGQDFPSYLKRVYTDRDFDFTFHPFTNMFDPTVGLQRFYTTDNYRKGVAFTNASHYSNPEIDRLFAEIAVEADVAGRKASIDRFQEIVADELPVLPLMLSKPVTVYNKRVVGHTIDSAGPQGNFADVWLRA